MTAIDEYHYQKLQDQITELRARQIAHADLVNKHEFTIANLLVENEKLNRLISECHQFVGSFRDDCK